MFRKHEKRSLNKEIESVEVNFQTLLKSKPPQFWVNITYSDGTKEKLTATRETIDEKYGPYLEKEKSNNKSDCAL